MALLTIDASVAIKWLVDETDSAKARSFLPVWNGDEVVVEHVLISPVFVLLETHYVLAKRLNKGEIAPEQLVSATGLLRQFLTLEAVDDQLAKEAEVISIGSQPTGEGSSTIQPYNIYDCVYLALANRLNSTLVTADKRQWEVAARIGVKCEFLGQAEV